MTDIYNEARWEALSGILVYDAKKADELMEYFGSTEELFSASESEIKALDFLTPGMAEKVFEVTRKDPFSEAERINCMGIDFYSREHPLFPKSLYSIDPVPIGLFVKGNLPDERHRAVAVVGSRTSSNYGRSSCSIFCKEFVKSGMDVISGMAIGIDAIAHESALAAGGPGKTYAVLGCGVDIVYPLTNQVIYDRITENGGVISEFYPGTKPQSYNFPIRNRIIAGLADAVFAVEARVRSGTLITVGCALDQGKEVYALPGRLTDKLSEGCNRLISLGATPALDPRDMTEQIAKLPPRDTGERTTKEYDRSSLNKKATCVFDERETARRIEADEARKVYLALDVEAKCIDEIAADSGMDVGRILDILVSLELDGFAKQVGPCMYVQCIPV
ncbi:MAG: DNA-processing protein DprA [Lachnospiraceae bacterium]|nr:DNA-processing protein DprA [Lachnospiraceae bacterium]